VLALVVEAGLVAALSPIDRAPQWFRYRCRLQTTPDALDAVATVLDGIALPPVHASVPPVLYRVVAAVPQAPRDLGPPLPYLIHHLLDQLPLH
jgi:hypothetical protein